MVNRYNDRPHSSFAGGKFSDLNELCYTEFLRYYYSAQGKVVDENDHQPEELLDELVEENHMLKNNLLKRYSSYVK